jgi:hypothetical protein
MPSWNGQNKTRRRKASRKAAQNESLKKRYEMSYKKTQQKRSKRFEESIKRELMEDWLDEQAEYDEDQYWQRKLK